VQPPDSLGTTAPLFVYLVDSLGFRALFRPRAIAYEDGRSVRVAGTTVRVPSRGRMVDARGADTLVVELEIEDATATDTRAAYAERGEAAAARRLTRPWFVQMKGRMRLRGVVGGERVDAVGVGFFETYR
jgi:hypothetical protein